MDIKPNIRTNLGPLSPRGFNKIAAKANERTTKDATRDQASGVKIFIAKIAGASPIISGRRWKYTWVHTYLKSSDKKFTTYSYPSETFLISSADTLAYNTCEALQQDSGLYDGPGITHTNIPAGYNLKEIATGTNVLMFQSQDNTSAVTFVFSLANAIDGGCS